MENIDNWNTGAMNINELSKCAEAFISWWPCKDVKMPGYNLKFKKQVQELAITCVYDYNTVYRVCSIFGFQKATDVLNMGSDATIQHLFMLFLNFPERMTANGEDEARVILKHVDPALPELFESLLESSEYNSETLYRVFMSHGTGAKEIVEYAIENELMPFQLLEYSDKKLSESAEEARNKMKELVDEIENQPVINLNVVGKKHRGKEKKLPRKLRNGWK